MVILFFIYSSFPGLNIMDALIFYLFFSSRIFSFEEHSQHDFICMRCIFFSTFKLSRTHTRTRIDNQSTHLSIWIFFHFSIHIYFSLKIPFLLVQSESFLVSNISYMIVSPNYFYVLTAFSFLIYWFWIFTSIRYFSCPTLLHITHVHSYPNFFWWNIW